MRKTKKNQTENGKQVFNAGMAETPVKGTTQNPDTTANDELSNAPTWQGTIYKALQGVELEKPVTSVSLAELERHANDVPAFIGAIRERNKTREYNNRRALITAAFDAFRAFPFASVEERAAATKIAKARFLNTKGFRLTFQAERTDETTLTYEKGAYYARPTTYTSAGIRTSFNSVEYTKRTAERLAAKKRQEEQARADRQALSGIDTAELLAHLTPAQLAALVAKVNA